jgi:hypothetical protein
MYGAIAYHSHAPRSTGSAFPARPDRFVGAGSIDYARWAGDRNMKSREDIESYLLKTGMNSEQLGPELWNIKPEGNENLLISIAGPVVVFRI